ncbi:MAG: molybdenum cofactor biosynthesis protein [Phycisphaeraceae bacterium]|nr:molybdenum cofactor biosynthesis protein [Phycisphaeraceae bacterium]
MRGFARRTTVADARSRLDASVHMLTDETICLFEAAGRVLASNVRCTVDVPGFARSMMDGYAVKAADTSGATGYNRRPLTVVGEVLAGSTCDCRIAAGQAVRIMTGAPLPDGADAVLPVEKTELESDRLFALDEVSPGKHVGRPGEDITAGTTVLNARRVLRPQDIGVLSSIGAGRVTVTRRPRVRIVVTGDELLEAGSTPEGHQIADANGPMLSALVARDGGVPVNPGIVADDRDSILAAMRHDADVVLVSGGSSVGQEDHAPTLLARHGILAVHGIAMRPSSPAGFGMLDGRHVFLLPGNPVSCLCAYDFFAGRAIRALGGRDRAWPYRRVTRPLRRKLVSKVGRVDYARVGLVDDGVEPIAISGASVLSSTTRADGFVVIDGDSEGFPAGAEVSVHLYDS